MASLHMRLGLEVDNGKASGLQLPQALLQEKNQEIDELKEQIFKLQKEMENTLDNKVTMTMLPTACLLHFMTVRFAINKAL